MPNRTGYEHIEMAEGGVPRISGSTMKVVELLSEFRAYGWSPEEMHFQHPTLSMAQIHSALAYYWDHKSEIDEDLERRLEKIEYVRTRIPPSPFVQRLKPR